MKVITRPYNAEIMLRNEVELPFDERYTVFVNESLIFLGKTDINLSVL